MTSPIHAPRMPYVGLRPFDEADHWLFFGREEQINSTLTRLEDHAFVAVVGSSGSGKSSFVRAGLLPSVREGFLLGTQQWRVAVAKPGHRPYYELARALGRRAPVAADADGPAPPVEDVERVLRGSDRGLDEALRLFGHSGAGCALVVIDQFEELFAFRRAGAASEGAASRDEAAAFVRLLLRSCADPSGRIRVVITMRSDFIGDCEAFLGLPEAISRSQLLVPRLGRAQMEWAITGPASLKEAGYRPFGFEQGLVNRLINDAGDRPDQLPLLQHALMQTWKAALNRAGDDAAMRLTVSDYLAGAGGIQDALSRHADAAWSELGEHPQRCALARRLFLMLCDVSPDGQITRRRPSVGEVQAVTGATLAEVKAVMQVFQRDDRNFLLPPADDVADSGTLLDISHESLIRQWRAFNNWLGEESEAVATFQRLRERALRWPKQEPLLRDPALSAALTWREQHIPTVAWAERHGGGLERVIEYLRESEAARAQEVEAALTRQREELEAAQQGAREQAAVARRNRNIAVALGLLLTVTAGTVTYVIVQYRAIEALSKNQQALTRDLKSLSEARRELEGQSERLKVDIALQTTQREALEKDRDDLTKKLDAMRASELALHAARKTLATSNAAMAAVGAANGTVRPARGGGLEVEFVSTDVPLRPALLQLPTLGEVRALSLKGTRVDDASLASLRELRDVQVLDLSHTDVSDAGVAQIARLPGLRSLMLNDTLITAQALETIGRMTALKSVDLSRTRVHAAAVDALRAQLPGAAVTYQPDPFLDALSELQGDWNKALSRFRAYTSVNGRAVHFFRAPITDATLKALGRFDDIDIKYCDSITNEGIKNLWRHTGLTSLTLGNDSQLTDEAVINISAMPSITNLKLDTLAMGDRSLAAVARMRGLMVLALSGASRNFSDRAIDELRALEKLEDFTLEHNGASTDKAMQSIARMQNLAALKLINLSNVTGRGYAALAALPKLKTLDLTFAKLSDDDIPHLQSLRQLKALRLHRAGISADGIAALRAGMPDTKIVDD